MSYEPNVWKDGDLVTSAKLNKMEQGIVNATSSGATSPTANLVAIMTSDTLDKTWQEIYDKNISVIIDASTDNGGNREFLHIMAIGQSDSKWMIAASGLSGVVTLVASTVNDYPKISNSN